MNPKDRPAETAAPIATVLAVLLARIIGVEDADLVGYIAIALSFVPAGVTWMVELLRK
jgi:predicted PurR-regulated permease PerM